VTSSARRLEARRRAERELALIEELQRDHHWAFSNLPREDDRHSLLFDTKTDAKGKKTHALVPAFKAVAMFPSTSPLAIALERAAKERGSKKSKTDARSPARSTRRSRGSP
jgi:hypothetical protein